MTKWRMDMHSRRQYLKSLQQRYLQVSRKEKKAILDEYVENTRHNRKYVIYKLNNPKLLCPEIKPKKRKSPYPAEINQPLAELWEIFDYACGQRLKPMIETELERLRNFGEINISDELSQKLKEISSATIDRRLKHEREVLGKRHFSTTKPGSLLKAKIPIRLTDWDTSKVGYVETDLVAHCGSSTFGPYLNTVSLTEIATGWWEGEAILGKGEKDTFEALKSIRARSPFKWKGLDSDNGGEFINATLLEYCQEEKLEFTRSRENKKNDNAYVEQKNWTHVRRMLGYFRYDTTKEQIIINDLYRNELRLYKNFFQPVMKLLKKERIGSKRTRKHEKKPKTPYQRSIKSDQINEEEKKKLTALYETLNPAELKRRIDQKIYSLYQAYCRKHNKVTSSKAVSKILTNIQKRGVTTVRC